MALGGVYMSDIDGNIGVEKTNVSEKVSGLLFDIAGQTNFWESGPAKAMAAQLKDAVVELNCLEDAIALGIVPYNGEKTEDTVTGEGASQVTVPGETKDFLYGIPYYHIKHYFQINGGSGRLFICFADCSENWNALNLMQRAAVGMINQFGIWTEQSLWRLTDSQATQYSIELVGDIQTLATKMANESHAPAVFILNANSAKVKDATDENEVVFSMIPNAKLKECRYVAISLSQGIDTEVSVMQKSLESKTPVGNIGALLGILSTSNVAESIGFVSPHNMGNYFPDVEFGFGNVELGSDGELKNTMRYSAMTDRQIDTLHDNGYIFLCKYAGLEGRVYFNGDSTCSEQDYRTIARNRVINKSRRGVRQALLPYVNSPLKIDPATGQLSAAQITVFKNLVEDVLRLMADAEEISGIGKVDIPAKQNVLKNDKLALKYSLIPMGTAQTIDVTEGFAVSQ